MFDQGEGDEFVGWGVFEGEFGYGGLEVLRDTLDMGGGDGALGEDELGDAGVVGGERGEVGDGEREIGCVGRGVPKLNEEMVEVSEERCV